MFFDVKAVPLVRVPPADYSKEVTGTRTEQRVKMNRMRLRIAQRLKEAQNVNAMLTTFNEIDMRFVFFSFSKIKKFVYNFKNARLNYSVISWS